MTTIPPIFSKSKKEDVNEVAKDVDNPKSLYHELINKPIIKVEDDKKEEDTDEPAKDKPKTKKTTGKQKSVKKSIQKTNPVKQAVQKSQIVMQATKQQVQDMTHNIVPKPGSQQIQQQVSQQIQQQVSQQIPQYTPQPAALQMTPMMADVTHAAVVHADAAKIKRQSENLVEVEALMTEIAGCAECIRLLDEANEKIKNIRCPRFTKEKIQCDEHKKKLDELTNKQKAKHEAEESKKNQKDNPLINAEVKDTNTKSSASTSDDAAEVKEPTKTSSVSYADITAAYQCLIRLRWQDKSDIVMDYNKFVSMINIDEFRKYLPIMKNCADNLYAAIEKKYPSFGHQFVNDEDRYNFLFHCMTKGEDYVNRCIIDPDFCTYLVSEYQPMYRFIIDATTIAVASGSSKKSKCSCKGNAVNDSCPKHRDYHHDDDDYDDSYEDEDDD